MTITQYFGLEASIMGIFLALAPLLQVRRILARRHAGDISQAFLWVVVAGASSYGVYGFVSHNWYIGIPNAIGGLTNLGTVLLARHYVRKAEALQQL